MSIFCILGGLPHVLYTLHDLAFPDTGERRTAYSLFRTFFGERGRSVTAMLPPLLLSLRVLLFAIPLLVLLGGGIGWLLARSDFPGKGFVSLLVQLPLILPPSVMGFYLLFTIGRNPFLKSLGILFSFQALVLAATVSALPIMIQSARAAFASVDGELEDAARTLGKGEWTVFRTITLPLARRTLLVGLALSAARALGDFGVSLMIAGNIPGRTQTLPLYIYNRVETLDFAGAHAASLLLVGTGFASLYLVRRLEEGRNERRAAC